MLGGRTTLGRDHERRQAASLAVFFCEVQLDVAERDLIVRSVSNVEQLAELRRRGVHVRHAGVNPLGPHVPQRIAQGASPFFLGIRPALDVRLDELDREADTVVGKNERFIAVVGVEDLVFEDGNVQISQSRNIGFDVVGLERDVLEAFTLPAEKLVDASFWIPVVDDMEPAVVAMRKWERT